ncbi:MAG: DUF3696 domain-containing protein [Intestinibacter sp.]|uniref:AAA family ATPase n=1 Tax=Intestinibacter sp. TaxID=1965304 RepID=UPI003F164EA6
MIKKLKIEGLKSIDKITLELSNLNLLVGVNSSGKSTIIQSLLIASQNISNDKYNFNGNLVSLGDYREVRNFITNAKNIDIEIDSVYDNYKFKFFEDKDVQVTRNQNGNELEFDKGLYYLSASRIGYLDTYEKNIKSVYKYGLNGEYCLDYLNKNREKILDENMVKDSTSLTLDYSVNYWFEYIIGGKVAIEDIKQTDRIKALFMSKNGRGVRTKNIGSGLSYLISIVIMCLSLEENETLIIENPEIHLHPKAQSRLIEFFIFISKANRQLIIETHSDHIFNGVRAGIANNEIALDDVSINFLSLDDRYCTVNNRIEIGKRGSIKNCPTDLFDQFDIDLDRMLGL